MTIYRKESGFFFLSYFVEKKIDNRKIKSFGDDDFRVRWKLLLDIVLDGEIKRNRDIQKR